MTIGDLPLPPELELLDAQRDETGETNEVYRCRIRVAGVTVAAYAKLARDSGERLANECAVLEALACSPLPVARVLWHSAHPRPVLIQEALPGRVLWDYLDPRREHYDPQILPTYLREYGRCLATIHELDKAWAPQRRMRLEGLIGEEEAADGRFEEPVGWLREHAPARRERVFVHGDLNTASVLAQEGRVTGVIDWEFAGLGWREYDLAWVLRARTAFLNTAAEREAILEGYRSASSYDEEALRWCEVLNYLHFAYWSRLAEPDYASFALGRAAAAAAR